MPNPLTDELTDHDKAVLAVKFAELKARFQPRRMWETRIDEHGIPHRVLCR